jgi:hypothetical protein
MKASAIPTSTLFVCKRSPNLHDPFSELEFVQIPGVDGAIAAVGWILHHGYTGSIPAAALVKGLRLRSGNLQVGDGSLFEDSFPEVRFNGWTVGEIHIVDRRLVPNGRRDNLEENVHLHNLLNYVAPIAKEISQRCRLSSAERKYERQFEFFAIGAKERIEVLSQRTLGPTKARRVESEIVDLIQKLEKLASRASNKKRMDARISNLKKSLAKSGKIDRSKSALDTLPAKRREIYEHLFGLIYDCSTNRVAAKSLVDKILKRMEVEKLKSA